MIAKDLKELLKGVPDDAEIWIPDEKSNDPKYEYQWEHCEEIEVHYNFYDDGETECDLLFIRKDKE